MLAVRTPGAPQTARVSAVFSSAFPITGEGQLLRSRSISGLFSRSLHSGLQPPCLRFAAAVTGRHARLGSRLLARLCRGRPRRRQTSTRLQGATRQPAPRQFLFDGLQLCPHTVPPGLPFDLEFSPASFAADNGEAQEGLRFAEPAPLAVCRRQASNLDQPGLLRMKRQRKLL